MENILLGLVFLILSFFGYSMDKKVFNPLFVVPFLWATLLILFTLLPHSLYALDNQFLLAILIWVLSFTVAGFLTFNFSKSPITAIDLYNEKIFGIYFYTVVVFAPIALISLVVEAMKVGPELFFLKLRMINTGLDEDDTFSLGKLGYIFNFTNVVCLLFTLYYSKISKFKYYVVLFLAFLLGLITLARTSLVVLSISIFVILAAKNVIKRKHYFYFISLFFIFILLVTLLRSIHENEQESSLLETFSIYLFSGMPAFDEINYLPTEEVGSNVFRFFYAILDALGYNTKVEKTILEYVEVPVPTNVYTVLYPFFKDFGYNGVGFFGIIYGFFYTILYKFYKIKSDFFIMLFAFFFPYLILQFFSDYLFLNLSTNMQSILFILFPYLLKNKKR
ncbi:O-antigen polymerase [Flavobacterium oreochromis]|uniref:O-antigen polymerase n=1 Tax=Flavobacterium oreochromis TaxID=2906078 RepID=UPI00385C033D